MPPVGYRFRPTPEELIHHYLQKKVNGEALPFEAVNDLDPFQSDPWKLFDEKSNEYFYVFTKMKVKDIAWKEKTVGSGTWVFLDCKEIRKDMDPIIGYDREFKLVLTGDGEAYGNWVMHQFSLLDDAYGGDEEAEVYVVCQFRNLDMDIDDDQ
ncbi:hypothetical protein L6164_031405 [Bauhinia variegata]|uniref:Uncharacterized protein n=1 Tax=Bauhinia variegata TaxID=167791 RepID=A0ACB9LFR3_BAUVA|nr:hypothetical protein L6164_031405 [Bauhinia variegata]